MIRVTSVFLGLLLPPQSDVTIITPQRKLGGVRVLVSSPGSHNQLHDEFSDLDVI